MCGIIGIIDRGGADEGLLETMRDAIAHRGPDAAGVWRSADGIVGLAHRRLSIIDLSDAGKQPMSDSDGAACITFNGEIYNFHEIRNRLESKGHAFKSHTDTEVILKAYRQWGFDCLKEFNGMFAFAIYDEKKRIVFLARDRAGKKPLYYTADGGKFAFASEIKSLLKDRSVSRDIDLDALNHYLAFGCIGGRQSIFRSVRKLPPACAMTYDIKTEGIRTWTYWRPPLPQAEARSEGELLEELEALLNDAVRLRMISDVPLGAFLSGGTDSSLIVALMSRISGSPVKTFSIGFDEGRYNELPYARIVARYFGTDHQEIMVKPDAFSVLPELARQFDEPFADSSLIPTYYVSRATRQYVTVALSGDGGDELFGGYSSYLGTLGNYYAAKFTPPLLRKGIAGAAGFLPDGIKGKRHLLRLGCSPHDAFIDRASHMYFKPDRRAHLLSKDVLGALGVGLSRPEASMRACLSGKGYDIVNRLEYADFTNYLPDDILVKVDRASMLVSLEVRSPLLDHRVAEFSFGKVPGNLKVKGMRTKKYLLKKLAKKLLPRELDVNRKWGFAVPVSKWFRADHRKQMKEVLLDSGSTCFQKDFVAALIDEHLSGMDHGGRLFTLLMFSLWTKNIQGDCE